MEDLEFYVYHLVDPRTGEEFYVGKGCGNRLNDHVKATLAGRASNARKHTRIREIIDSGRQVIAEVIDYFESEEEALAYERDRIAIGGDRLTNICAGGALQSQAARRAAVARVAKHRLARVIPYYKWVRLRKWGEESKALYMACFDALVRAVNDPNSMARAAELGPDGRWVLKW